MARGLSALRTGAADSKASMDRIVDWRRDPDAWARTLGVSREATSLCAASEVLDLHVDTFIWQRLFRYDLTRRHGRGPVGGRYFGQCDLPRAIEGGLTGATWVITTNPWRTPRGRVEAFVRNVERLRSILGSVSEHVALVRNAREYRLARLQGRHGAFIGVQGGNALDATADALDLIPDDVISRVTLVHLTSSRIGVTSSPLKWRDGGLTDWGRDFVRRLDHKRILVDLAHISRRGFFDAAEAHDPSLPLIVTHTGVSGVHPHWRNLDDEQLRVIAQTGGTVGIMYHASFLGRGAAGRTIDAVVDHLAHIVKTVGEDHASLGSDWDGAIVPPRELATSLDLPRLVERMLARGWSAARIQKILAGNALRVIEAVRG